MMPTSKSPDSTESLMSHNLRPTPPKALTTIRSMHLRRNAPPPIPIPINPIRGDLEIARPKRQPEAMSIWNRVGVAHRPAKAPMSTTVPNLESSKSTSQLEDVDMVPIELSNYPPHLAASSIIALFSSYPISPDFHMPPTTNFAYPLRTIIWIRGRDEANRAMTELNGMVVGARKIRVARLGPNQVENGEGKENELKRQCRNEQGKQEDARENTKADSDGEVADEMKIGIVSTAHAYYPNLIHKVLEVCECTDGTAHYAFLQAREHIATHNQDGGDLAQTKNAGDWELVASGRADSRGALGRSQSVRLGALKNLQRTIDEQGMLAMVWSRSCTS